MRRTLKFVLIGLAWCATASLAGTIAAYWFLTPATRIIAEWHQPANIQYHSADPYTLSVEQWGFDLHAIPWQYTYMIWISSGREPQDYGHLVYLPLSPEGDDPDADISKSKVEWSNDGVTFIESTGHSLFIPKKAFTGGR